MSFRVYYLAPTVELACGRRKVEVVWFTCLSVSLLGCLFICFSFCLFVCSFVGVLLLLFS